MPTRPGEGSEEERRRRYAEERADELEAYRARATPTGADTYGGYGDPETEVSSFDETSADIPIWGWLSGAGARRDAARNRQDQLDAQATWQGIGQGPSWEELAPQYREATGDEFGELIGESAFGQGEGADARYQVAALDALQSLYNQGGYTDADRAMSQAMRAQQARTLGSANQAALQQAQARGMGGSGAELAARLSGSEAMNYANSQNDAQIQMAAMNRALQAIQGVGTLGTAYQSGQQNRRAALDAFNQSNLDWRRGRETRNTNWANQEGTARQQAYENAQNWAAGMTNQYQGAQSNRRMDAGRRDEADERGANAIGAILGELF
jgi:hypothetical protein